MPGLDGLLQQKEGQKGDKYRVAAEQHSGHRGPGVPNRQVEDGHTQSDAQQAQQGETGHAPAVQALSPALQGPQSQGQQDQKAHGEAAQGQLHGVDLPAIYRRTTS